MLRVQKIIVLVSIVLLAAAFSACDKEGPAEKAGAKVDEAVEKAGEKIEEATDAAADKIEKAGDAVSRKTN